MRVLILGASGFLGRHIHALLHGNERFEVKVGPRSRDLDLTHASHTVWHKVLQDAGAQVVVNCAGLTHGSSEDLLLANVSLVDHLVRAAQDQRSPPRIVHLGSAAEYGPEAQVAAETTPACPASPYGESKLMIERALFWADQLHGLRSACLRYFNAAGADPNGVLGEDHDPETHLIPLAIDAALGRSDAITVFGTDYPTADGTCVRDYVHVTSGTLSPPWSGYWDAPCRCASGTAGQATRPRWSPHLP